jgi:NAD(P)-dependent dehydrogenase (short-subunit alcohol dehydrogenase family)
MNELKGKVAFITGAASGIGFELARACVAQGMKVMLGDIDQEGLEQAVVDLSLTGGEVRSVICNVTDFEAVKSAATATIEHFGKVHLVINNAGILVLGRSGELSMKTWRKIFDINVMGVIHGVEAFLPLFRKHGEGAHFVNTASVGGHVSYAGWAPYCSSKFAVVGYSESLAAELAPEGIGVSILCPGIVNTGLADSLQAEHGHGDELAEAVKAGMSPAVVAEYTLEQVIKNALYIFTHPGTRAEVEERFPLISTAFTETEGSALILSDPDSKRAPTKGDTEVLSS